MVVAVPLVMGGEPKVSEDGTPVVEGSSIMGKIEPSQSQRADIPEVGARYDP